MNKRILHCQLDKASPERPAETLRDLVAKTKPENVTCGPGIKRVLRVWFCEETQRLMAEIEVDPALAHAIRRQES